MQISRTILLTVIVAATACGAHQSGGMSGPTLSGSVNDEDEEPRIQSNDVLARDNLTSKSKVKHILIGWRDLQSAYRGQMDERAAKRTREMADAVAEGLLKRVQSGEPIEPLMMQFSEDPGSKGGVAYEVTRDAPLAPAFKRLGLRLKVGESGLVLTSFGWHIIKRVK